MVLTQDSKQVSDRMACEVLALSRSGVYAEHRRRTFCGPRQAAKTARMGCQQPRQLTEAERKVILDTLNSDEFYDQPPTQVYHTRLSRGIY